jgi:hypothetical protein
MYVIVAGKCKLATGKAALHLMGLASKSHTTKEENIYSFLQHLYVITLYTSGLIQHNIQTNKYTNIQMAVYSEREALQKTNLATMH